MPSVVELALKKIQIIAAVLIVVVLISAVAIVLMMSKPKPEENRPPVANFTMDKTSAKINEPVTFTSTSYDPDGNETIVKHLWEFGDGSNKTGNLRNTVHAYSQPGVYTVTLTVEDEKGAQNSVSKTLSVTQEVFDEYQNVTVNELLTNSQNYLEKKVRLNGCIVADKGYYSSNLTNSTTFYVVDDGGTRGLNIYTEANATRPVSISYNEKLVIKGTFTTYKEAFELKVSAGTPDAVETTGTFGNNAYSTYTVASLLANAPAANYSFVKIENAIVDWVNKSYKYTIRDEGTSENITVYCEFGSNNPSVSAGANVSVQGWFKYYSKEGVWEITIRNGTDDKVELQGVTYISVTVNELLANPASYLNKSVELSNVVYAYKVHWNASNVSDYVSFYVVDNTGIRGVNVFGTYNATRPSVVHYGDLLHIKGKFELYNNAYEIYVSKSTTPDLIDKTGTGGNNNYQSYSDINTLLGSTTTANNSFVRLENMVVDYVYASYRFTIRDTSTSTNITVYGEYGANIPSVSAGMTVNVSGWFTWYSTGAYWEIVIRNATTDSVEVYGQSQNYTAVTVNELLANPNNYLNKNVELNNVVYAYKVHWNASNISDYVSFYAIDNSGIRGVNVYATYDATRPSVVYYGDLLHIKGKFELYNNAYEIYVGKSTTPDLIDKTGTGGSNNYQSYSDINTLLGSTTTANNSFVRLENMVVDYVYASYRFTIRDTSTSTNITVYGEYGANIPSVSAGMSVNVSGWFTWYSTGAYWEIVIRNATTDSVEVYGQSQNYTAVTVNELLANPNNYLNKNVELNNVVYAYKVHWNASNISDYVSFYAIDNSGIRGVNVYATYDATRPSVVYYGDLLHIKGKFELYNNAYEIYVGKSTTPDLIDKTGTGGNNNYQSYSDINTLLGSTTTANNSFVRLENMVVDYVYASYRFTIRDTSTSTNITVYGEYGANIPSVSAGMSVNVSGWFTWYSTGAYWEIVIRNATTDSVEVYGQSQNYTTVTVNELLANPNNYLNKNVELNNVVYAYKVHWNASNISDYVSFYAIDNSGIRGVNVYATYDATRPSVVYYGDLLHIKGKFELYNNAYEIYVGKSTTPDLIDKTGTGGNNNYQSYSDINTLLGSTTTANNSFVRLENMVVDYVYASYRFTIRDTSTSTNITVYGEYGANIPSVSAGMSVNVSGWFTWYSTGAYWEIVIRNATTDSVEVGSQSPYTQVSVATLLANPNQYNNTEVCIKNAYVDWAKTTYNFNIRDSPSDLTNLTIYVSKNAKAQSIYTGYYVDVYGVFEWYATGGYWEIYIRNYTDDMVIAVFAYQAVTISALLSNPSIYLSQNVTLDYAVITEITANYYLFNVTDNSTSQKLTIYVQKNATSPATLSVGQAVKIKGVFKLYNSTYEIQVRNYSTDAVILITLNEIECSGGITWKEVKTELTSLIVRSARDL